MRRYIVFYVKLQGGQLHAQELAIVNSCEGPGVLGRKDGCMQSATTAAFH